MIWGRYKWKIIFGLLSLLGIAFLALLIYESPVREVKLNVILFLMIFSRLQAVGVPATMGKI